MLGPDLFFSLEIFFTQTVGFPGLVISRAGLYAVGVALTEVREIIQLM
jgi:hypothetical protein